MGATSNRYTFPESQHFLIQLFAMGMGETSSCHSCQLDMPEPNIVRLAELQVFAYLFTYFASSSDTFQMTFAFFNDIKRVL